MVDLSLKPALTAAGTKRAAKALASTEARPAAYSRDLALARAFLLVSRRRVSVRHRTDAQRGQ